MMAFVRGVISALDGVDVDVQRVGHGVDQHRAGAAGSVTTSPVAVKV